MQERSDTARSAATVMAIAISLASLFALSYSLALGRPTPHHIPAAQVGSPAAGHQRLIAALERQTRFGLHLSPYRDAAAAERAIEGQQVYAALLLNRSPPELLIASAAGISVARVLAEAAPRAVAASRQPLLVRDLRPLPKSDPQGLVSFYVTLAATLLGFVTMFQLRANVSGGMNLRQWLLAVLVLGLAGGFMLALISGPLLGSLPAPFAELWAALAAQILAAALFNCTMLTLIGKWAFIPTWGFFVALGNAASGGAVAPPLLPSFYGFIGRFLPTGATVETVRNAVYFPGEQHAQPMVVVAVWILVGLGAFLVSARWSGRTPSPA